MKMGRNYKEQRVIESIYRNEQGHLLRFWKDLDDGERDLLIKDMRGIDFEVLKKAKTLLLKKEALKKVIEQPAVIGIPESSRQTEEEKEAREKGISCIYSSKAAVFTAAGGQSSRLGLDSPKGTYPVTPLKRKSLFQVHAEKIFFMQKKYKTAIPWIIMVSETNKDQTARFFQDNRYFGLDRDYIRFIEQGMFPSVDEEGKIFLRERFRVFLSPSGHGGTFSALKESGALSWLNELGVKEIFYFQVDNVLVKILDPVFIGYHVEKGCGMSSKCVRKKTPDEKVGVFAATDGKITVVEYSDLSTARTKDGKSPGAAFDTGSIAVHMINVDFAEQETSGANSLPLHLAHKAVPFIDSGGKKVEPEGSNGYKIETFIFDALMDSAESVIMEVRREDEFSPLKNKTGNDSPESVMRDQLLFFSGWFEEAGFSIPRASDGRPRYKLEVSPLFAVSKGDFIQKINRDIVVDRDMYIE